MNWKSMFRSQDDVYPCQGHATRSSQQHRRRESENLSQSRSASSRWRSSESSSTATRYVSRSSPHRSSLNRAQRRLLKRVRRGITTVTSRFTDRRTLVFINLATLLYLVGQTTLLLLDMMRTNTLPSILQCAAGQCDHIPYPLDVAVQARMRRISLQNIMLKQVQHPGYSRIKEGTFRAKYPSLSLSDAFDGVFAISNPKCHSQWKEFIRRASKAGLAINRWQMIPFKSISLDSPPLPILAATMLRASQHNKAHLSILKRDIAYLDAHRGIWQAVINKAKQRVLVIDDTVFPTEKLLHLLPNLFNQVDQESIASQKPWHVLSFRRKILHWNMSSPSNPSSEHIWCSNPRLNHPVVRAVPSHGSSMYALSLAGARWMFEHVRIFRAPMDMEIALLQRDYPDEFVVLSACNNDEPRDFCPEIVTDITIANDQRHFECSWRRLYERRTAALSDKTINL